MRCLEPIWRRGVSELISRALLASSVDVPERVGCKMSGLHFAKPTLLIAELPIGMNDLAWKMFSVLNIPALKTSKALRQNAGPDETPDRSVRSSAVIRFEGLGDCNRSLLVVELDFIMGAIGHF